MLIISYRGFSDICKCLYILLNFKFILAYRTEEGEPYVLPVVRSIESSMAADKTLNHEYLPIEGNVDLASGAKKLILGKDSPALEQNRVSLQKIIPKY